MTTNKRTKPPTKITLGMIREMVSLYEAGWTISYIAEKLGVHRTTVAKYLKLNDVEIRKDYTVEILTHRDYDQVIFLYTKMGLSCAAVGKIIGKSKSTIQYRLVRAGVERRSRREAQKIRQAKEKSKSDTYKTAA